MLGPPTDTQLKELAMECWVPEFPISGGVPVITSCRSATLIVHWLWRSLPWWVTPPGPLSTGCGGLFHGGSLLQVHCPLAVEVSSMVGHSSRSIVHWLWRSLPWWATSPGPLSTGCGGLFHGGSLLQVHCSLAVEVSSMVGHSSRSIVHWLWRKGEVL
ncbi:hypothetical protein ACOMHN_000064 [Nucella lapillus]